MDTFQLLDALASRPQWIFVRPAAIKDANKAVVVAARADSGSMLLGNCCRLCWFNVPIRSAHTEFQVPLTRQQMIIIMIIAKVTHKAKGYGNAQHEHVRNFKISHNIIF